MRFQVPQFIEVEDKIFGPLTLKQFIYLAGAAGIVVILWAILPTFLAFIVGAPIVGLAVALSFVKINDRPSVDIIESAFSYLLKTRLYLWKKKDKKITAKERDLGTHENTLKVPTISESKLKDLSWSLDIRESIYSDKDQR